MNHNPTPRGCTDCDAHAGRCASCNEAAAMAFGLAVNFRVAWRFGVGAGFAGLRREANPYVTKSRPGASAPWACAWEKGRQWAAEIIEGRKSA